MVRRVTLFMSSQKKHMIKKTRIAFIKFAGLSPGGTERWLQMMAVNLPKDKFEIDYYYCDSAPYLGSDYKHADTDQERLKYMLSNDINLIKFNVGFKDVTVGKHNWINTNFWDVFDSSKYDFVQTAKAGDKEYPYYLIDLPIVEYVTLSGGVDFSTNLIHSIHLSEWQRLRWVKKGGSLEKSSLIPIPVERPVSQENLREELGIPDNAIVAGYHQRPDNNIFSEIPLKSFSEIQKENFHFIIMGGGDLYRKQARDLSLKNVHFLEASSDPKKISAFLNTLNIFAHGRKDGETFGTVLAEGMIHGLPCLSHYSGIADAQPETMGPGGLFAMDQDDYTNKLMVFFENEKLRREIGDLGKDYAEKFYTIEGVVKSLCEVYDKAVQDIALIDKSIWVDIQNTKDKELQSSITKTLLFHIKTLIYNKYIFILYRFALRMKRKLII